MEPILQSECSCELPIIDTYPERELLDINFVLFMDYQQGESKKEQKGKEPEVIPALTELKFIIDKIKGGTPMRDQSNDDLTINSENVSCTILLKE